MHFGLEPYIGLVLYLGASGAFLMSILWRPQAGLYFLVPLLPLQTIRYKIMDYPLGNKLIDLLLLGVVLGAALHGGFRAAKTSMNKLLLFFGLFCYVELWRGAFYLNSDLPLSISDPRFSSWKNYMVMFVLFTVVSAVIKDMKQIKILVVLMCLSLLAVNKGYYGNMSDRDLSHFSYEVRDGGPLGYAGVNGVATFEAELMLFLLGLNAFEKRKSRKVPIWALLLLSAYCLLFSFSREAYAGMLVGLFFLGLLRQRLVLVALTCFLLSWEAFVPVSVQERVLMTYDRNEQQLDTSAQDRVLLWNDAMNLFRSNPIVGAGFDTYRWQHRVGNYTDTHNYFLKVMVETGLVGLWLFLFVLAKASRMALRLFRTAQDPFLKSLGLGFSLLMACVFVVNFFGDRWLYIEVNGFLWVLLACVVRGQIIEEQISQKQSSSRLLAEPESVVEEPVYA